jgi:hypothetical protein
MRSTSSSQKGASAVEFAIVLPLLVFITFGIVEFGVFLYDKQIITNACREGARAGVVLRYKSGVMDRLSEGETANVVGSYSTAHLITFGNTNVPVTQCVTGCTPGAISGSDLRLRVTYNYSFLMIPRLSPMLGGTFDAAWTMQAETVMKYE